MVMPEYVHFNKSIIDDILFEDAEIIEIAKIEHDDDYDIDSDSSDDDSTR